MKLQILQENLGKAVTLASRFTSNRAQLPILSNILLNADKANLTISSTNLEISVSTKVGAKIEEDGIITIPAKVLSELVGNLGKKTINLESDKEQLKISTESFHSSLLGMNASDFPTVPQEVNEKDSIKISAQELSGNLSKILFAVSSDETRPILTGVLFILNTEGLTLVATDGFRLSKTKISGIKGVSAQVEEKSFVIPKNILVELVRVTGDGEILINLQDKEKQAVFGVGEGVYSSRLIEGEFPNFEKIIPTSHIYKISVDKNDFLQAVKLAGVFARDNANIVKLAISDQQLVISAESSASGNQETKIEARISNLESSNTEEFTISFNYKFIEEFIGSVTGDEIEVQFSSTHKAGVFLDPKSPYFLHLIMPVRV